jgi:hypothetical protein
MGSQSIPSHCLGYHLSTKLTIALFDYSKASPHCWSHSDRWYRTGANYHDLGSGKIIGFIVSPSWLFDGCSTGRCIFSGKESLVGSG